MFLRVTQLNAGLTLVVTDLHGDWALYQRYRDVFLGLWRRGLAETLVFTGDLIHSEGPPETDHSLEIVLDLLNLRAELGSRLVVLLGNHEMPHLYHITLAKGEHTYTPRFEAQLGEHRGRVLEFFDSLPFYARSPAGVALCHAGAFPQIVHPDMQRTLFNFSHHQVLARIAARIPPEKRPRLRDLAARQFGSSYALLARHHLAVYTPEDPRYDDYLIGLLTSQEEAFELLWAALFTTNERQYGADYPRYLTALLDALSENYAPQRVLVTGHMGCQGYHVLGNGQQLRIASGVHSRPASAARYLLFDAERPIHSAEDLLGGLGRLYAP